MTRTKILHVTNYLFHYNASQNLGFFPVVGIGTTSPEATLHVNGSIKANNLSLNGGSMESLELTGKKIGSSNNYKYLQLGTTGVINGYDDSRYFFGNNWIVNSANQYTRIQQGAASAISLEGDEKIYFYTAPDGAANSAIDDASFVCIHQGNLGVGVEPAKKLHVQGDSYLNGTTHITDNVGIGSEPSSTYKLGVNGTIGCRKVVVTNTGWADYVFEQDYKLMSLNELESFIQNNKHLPEVPSAAHIEENGVELSEMNVLLLKKVEELTLYILQQNQDIQTLKEEVQSLKEGR